MCGIIGSMHRLSAAPLAPEHLDRLHRGLARMHARGPDAQEVCQHGRVALGHCRLAVIDPANGDQPRRDPDSGAVITYNGEVYNFRQLRRELQALGHAFETDCDTEVVLRAWLEWGADALERFVGFFAMAIYEPARGRLTLVRDRLGLKPLYWAEHEHGVAFASSIAALLPLVGNDCRPDPAVLSHYLSSRLPVLGDRTLVAGVHLLPPATCLAFDLDELTRTTRTWWQLPRLSPAQKRELSLDDAVAGTRELLTDAVTARLVSDVPLGAFLSGGLDSSIITLLAHRSQPGLPVFCAGSDAAEMNEFDYAAAHADGLGLDLRREVIDASRFADTWRLLIREKHLPLSTPNEISIYALAAALRRECTVTLTGEGADEVLGGYIQPQFGAYDYDRTPRQPEDERDDELSWALRLAFGRAWFMNDTDHHLSTGTWLRLPEKQDLFRDGVWDALEGDAEMICFYEDFFNALDGCSTFDKRMHLHARLNLENLLLRVDSSTMAASVEARVPFTDHRLVELAFSLPDEFKMRWRDADAEAASQTLPVARIDDADLLETKVLARRAFAADLAPAIVGRRKMSFPVPFTDWFGGALAGHIEELCLDSALTRDYFRRPAVERMLNQRDPRLWLVANLAAWWEETRD